MALPTLAHAEIFLWQDTAIDRENNIVNYHAFYQFEDTSANNVGRHKKVPIEFRYGVQPLPFTLPSGSVDECNFTIYHYKHEYDSDGDITATETEASSIFFTTDPVAQSGSVVVDMLDLDQVVANMGCHYTTNQSLYEENVLVGTFATFMPSFECKGCTDTSLAEQTEEIDRQEDSIADNLSMYTIFFNIVQQVFLVYTYAFWLIRIGVFIAGLSVIFSLAFFIYHFIEGLVR